MVFAVLAKCPWPITEVVCGCANGVDNLGKLWALENNLPVKYFPAQWEVFGRAAGPVRNQEMAEYAEALVCVHSNTSGSLDMVRRARQLGLRVMEHVTE